MTSRNHDKKALRFHDKIGLFIIGLLLFLITVGLLGKEREVLPADLTCVTQSGAPEGGVSPMAQDCFWKIIKFSKVRGTGQASKLQKMLQRLSPDGILSFAITFRQNKSKVYHNDLWAVAYIAKGGCSDDCFDYFQSWLISKGKQVFFQALKNPDSLVDAISKETRNGPALENGQYSYIPFLVWEQKTGKEASGKNNEFMSILLKHAPYPKLKGRPFNESESYLSKHFPKMWQRFGKNPL